MQSGHAQPEWPTPASDPIADPERSSELLRVVGEEDEAEAEAALYHEGGMGEEEAMEEEPAPDAESGTEDGAEDGAMA